MDDIDVALVGAGPTAASLLERLIANAPELLDGCRLRVHLIDPHRAGTGRVWRPDLHPGLWMNSMAEDVTMFTDDSVRCEGPVRAGPSLHEWAHQIDGGLLDALAPPALATEIRQIGPMTFPTRRVQSVYLDWFHHRLLASLPPCAEIVEHRALAVDLTETASGDGRQRVLLADGRAVEVDTVVLALGHLDSAPDLEAAQRSEFAARHGLVHLPPGHTAELDLDGLGPGADVIALGLGQAFTDLLVLVTEGRGGRFHRLVVDGHDVLRYEPSGLEPNIHVGSRRGVPYRSKLSYRLVGPSAPLPMFLDDHAIESLASRAPLDFRRDVLPLVAKEVSWAYYHELFHAHPDRVTTSWADFRDRLAAADPVADRAVLDDLVRSAVPESADRFDIDRLDRPLHGLVFADADALHAHVVGHVAADVARRTDDAFSADLGAFNGLVSSFAAIARLAATGAFAPRSRVDDVGGWWFSFFMYYASGPPPERLQQLVALADAGVVRFLGADTVIELDEGLGRFVASSSSHRDTVAAGAVIDARIAPPSLSRTSDELLRQLHARGDVVEEVVTDGLWRTNTGKVVVSGADLRLVRADGTAHPRRHALGVFTNRPAAGAFARPRTNAPAFRQNDAVARSILTRHAQLGAGASATGASLR